MPLILSPRSRSTCSPYPWAKKVVLLKVLRRHSTRERPEILERENTRASELWSAAQVICLRKCSANKTRRQTDVLCCNVIKPALISTLQIIISPEKHQAIIKTFNIWYISGFMSSQISLTVYYNEFFTGISIP